MTDQQQQELCPCVKDETPRCHPECWHFGGKRPCGFCGEPGIAVQPAAVPAGDVALLRAIHESNVDCAVVVPARPVEGERPSVDDLAQLIRITDGNKTMGAGALAEVICDWLTETQPPVPPDDALRRLLQEARDALGIVNRELYSLAPDGSSQAAIAMKTVGIITKLNRAIRESQPSKEGGR